MRYLFVLSREDVNLAKEEVLALVKNSDYKLLENILIVEIESKDIIKKLAKRLAYTSSVYEVLFQSSYGNFLKDMGSYAWNSAYKGSFCVRNNWVSTINYNPLRDNGKKYSEKELAGYIWGSVKKPKVDLEKPKTLIEIFFFKDKILCCLLSSKIRHDFEKRKSHLRPRPSPISLHPKLARAMVNLTGAQENDVVLDPFCGSGGILIEAGLMGMKAVGYDINKKMVWKSMVNLKHYNIKNFKLGVKDFFNLNKKYDYIAADLPYGLNTNIMENIRVTRHNKKQMKKYLEQFYSKVVKQLEKVLVKKATIIFPNYVGYRKMIKNSKLKLIKEFESYVHGNLTRKIVVLKR